jgi:hypothetical protein
MHILKTYKFIKALDQMNVGIQKHRTGGKKEIRTELCLVLEVQEGIQATTCTLFMGLKSVGLAPTGAPCL